MASNLIEMTAEIVSGYTTGNAVEPASLPGLITTVYQSLVSIKTPLSGPSSTRDAATPAQIKKSIGPDGLVSFEDGRSYKALKGHLTRRGLTFDEYKTKWGLPSDYPSTAVNFSKMRSEMAKTMGLGNRRRADTVDGLAKKPPKRLPP